MFGLGIFDALKIGAGAALGALLVSAPVYFYGKHDGRKAERVAQLEADVASYIKREGIDNEVDSMDLYRICLDVAGGLPNECGQLRGVEEAAAGE